MTVFKCSATSDNCNGDLYLTFQNGKVSIIRGAETVYSICLDKYLAYSYSLEEIILNQDDTKFLSTNSDVDFFVLTVNPTDYNENFDGIEISTNLKDGSGNDILVGNYFLPVKYYIFLTSSTAYKIKDIFIKNVSEQAVKIKYLKLF